jgi:sporadic carbohydrate cluster protein (TIGR04323 family)|tara:strand:+ start:1051 stop:1509 length:459 start_codon:yes stop_codon:yes gene_type:complete
MKKIRRFAGYINLKPINGVLYPSSIQNILMKDYVTKSIDGKFYLSPTEVLQAKYSVTLNTLLDSSVNVKGIVMLSAFSLPLDYKHRKDIYKKTILTKKELHFIFDELIFKNKADIDKIENQLIYRNNFFTKTWTKISENELPLIKKFNHSFV